MFEGFCFGSRVNGGVINKEINVRFLYKKYKIWYKKYKMGFGIWVFDKGDVDVLDIDGFFIEYLKKRVNDGFIEYINIYRMGKSKNSKKIEWLYFV